METTTNQTATIEEVERSLQSATGNLKPEESYELQREVLQKRIDRGTQKAKAILETIERDGNMLNDYLVPIGTNGEKNLLSFTGRGGLFVNVPIKGGDDSRMFSLHRNALSQVSQKLGINGKYVSDMINGGNEAWRHELMAHTLNEFANHSKRSRVLLRTVGDEARGFLSDRYKRYDSQQLLGAYIEACKSNGMQFIDAAYNGIKKFAEAVYTNVFAVETSKNGVMYFFFGTRFVDSEFGASRYAIQGFFGQSWCYNKAVSESVIAETHLGGKIKDLDYADDTMQAITEAMGKTTRDVVNKLMSKDAIQRHVAQIQAASDKEVDLDKSYKHLLSNSSLLVGEVEELKKIITNNNPRDGVTGMNTQLKLSQAIGRLSVLTKDDMRKRELDDLAGELITGKKFDLSQTLN